MHHKMRLRVHPSTVIFAVLLVALDRSAVSLMPFAAALCHELGHLTVMRLTGSPVAQLELTLFGAQINALPTNTGALCTAAIYSAGAAANLITAALAAILPYRVQCTDFFIACSLSLAFINLLPIRSLDGGGILYALLCVIAPDRAHTILDIVSAVTLVLLWLIAVYLLLVFDANISLMLFCAYLFITLFLQRQ